MLAALVLAATLSACSGQSETAPATATGGGVPTSAGVSAPASTGPTPTGSPVQGVPGTATDASPTSQTSDGGTVAGSGSLAGRTVLLDPGHNGGNSANPSIINQQVDAGGFQKACNTTGTAANGVTESSVNLEIAQLLAGQLEQQGATVVLTRQDDSGVGPCIDERGAQAAQVGADVLVSIHADGAAAGAHGFHVIAPGSVAGYTDGIVEPSSELARDIRDGLTGQGFSTSSYAGQAGLVTRSDLGTLNHARVPAVMLELGNMHNTGDFERLNSPDGQARYADGITAGLQTYFG